MFLALFLRETKKQFLFYKSIFFLAPSSFTAVSSPAKIEMNEDHKLNETNSSKEEMKLVVRSYPDPFYFPADDVFGRNYPTFAPREVESLRKKLNSFDDGRSTEFYSARDQIVGNPVEGKYTYRALDSLSSRLDGMFIFECFRNKKVLAYKNIN